MNEIQSVNEYVDFQRVSTDCNKTSLVDYVCLCFSLYIFIFVYSV